MDSRGANFKKILADRKNRILSQNIQPDSMLNEVQMVKHVWVNLIFNYNLQKYLD